MNDSISADAGAPPGVAQRDALTDAAAPEFRTVGTDRGRAGIRIERVFWDSLEALSQAQGLKRRDLVASIIAVARAADMNVASALRSYVASAQRAEIDRLRGLISSLQVVRLLQAAPVPSFALNRQKRLLRANPEFVHYLRQMFTDPTANVSPEVAQLSFERPIERLYEELKSDGSSTRCALTIRVNDQHRRVSCKIVAAPPFPAQAIVGYVLG